jgi:hypothetical protein
MLNEKRLKYKSHVLSFQKGVHRLCQAASTGRGMVIADAILQATSQHQTLLQAGAPPLQTLRSAALLAPQASTSQTW